MTPSLSFREAGGAAGGRGRNCGADDAAGSLRQQDFLFLKFFELLNVT